MTTAIKIRTGVLAVHGALALGLGLTFFYLRATMTNLLFEAIAITIAILLSAAALILAAITDWFAAFSEGITHLHRFTFYALGGLAFVLTGFFLGYYPQVSMQVLVWFAVIHALAFGVSALAFAFKAHHHPLERRAMYLFGTASVVFSGVMAGWVRDLDNLSATAVLGWYLCFVGVKMLFFAWDSHRTAAITDRLWLPGGKRTCVLHTTPLPTNATKH